MLCLNKFIYKERKWLKNIHITEDEVEIPILEICKYGMMVSILPIILLFFVYYFIRGTYDFLSSPWTTYFITLAIFIGLFALHELVHGIAYYVYNGRDFKSIHFGTDEEYLKPYCKCYKSIDVNKFIISKLAPIIISGVIPYILSVIFGNFFLMLASLLTIFSCGVDIILVMEIRKHKEIKKIKDNDVSYGYMRFSINKE